MNLNNFGQFRPNNKQAENTIDGICYKYGYSKLAQVLEVNT